MTENHLILNLNNQLLTPNLHEKMEYIISHFIGELYDAGLKTLQEDYKRIQWYDAFIINVLFDLPKVVKFNQIANNYFNEEDKHELQRYWRPDPKKRRVSHSEYNYIYMYVVCRNFAKQNRGFIENVLNSLDNSKPVLK
jgi:hypothetical protein